MQTLRPIGGGQEQQVVELPVIVATGQGQALVCTTIPLPTPALEVKEIRKTVIIDSCKAIPDKVIVDGRLRNGSGTGRDAAPLAPRRQPPGAHRRPPRCPSVAGPK